jgi:hypothetical protein
VIPEGAFLGEDIAAACAALEQRFGPDWREVEVEQIRELTEELRALPAEPEGCNVEGATEMPRRRANAPGPAQER